MQALGELLELLDGTVQLGEHKVLALLELELLVLLPEFILVYVLLELVEQLCKLEFDGVVLTLDERHSLLQLVFLFLHVCKPLVYG